MQAGINYKDFQTSFPSSVHPREKDYHLKKIHFIVTLSNPVWSLLYSNSVFCVNRAHSVLWTLHLLFIPPRSPYLSTLCCIGWEKCWPLWRICSVATLSMEISNQRILYSEPCEFQIIFYHVMLCWFPLYKLHLSLMVLSIGLNYFNCKRQPDSFAEWLWLWW
jgi:hypothetical protein